MLSNVANGCVQLPSRGLKVEQHFVLMLRDSYLFYELYTNNGITAENC